MTVASQVAKLKRRFGVKQVVFVGDRGMIKAGQKAILNEAGLRYITALTDPQIRSLMKARVITPELFDTTVQEVVCEDRRVVLRRNEATARKERHRRDDKLALLRQRVSARNQFVAQHPRAQLEAGLRQLQAWASRHKLANLVTLAVREQNLELTVDDAALADAALLDGCYALETDVSSAEMDAATVHARYMDLQKVERNFRTMKTVLLNIRPLYVRTEEHTRGAVFVAMLALKVTREMQARLQARFGTADDDATSSTSPREALEVLSRLCYQRFQIGGQSILRLPRPDDRQQAVLDALGVVLP
jgi:hypothetical protein